MKMTDKSEAWWTDQREETPGTKSKEEIRCDRCIKSSKGTDVPVDYSSVEEKRSGLSQEGTTQGDPPAMSWYAINISILIQSPRARAYT